MFVVVRDRMQRHVPAARVVAAIFSAGIFVIEYVEEYRHTLHVDI